MNIWADIWEVFFILFRRMSNGCLLPMLQVIYYCSMYECRIQLAFRNMMRSIAGMDYGNHDCGEHFVACFSSNNCWTRENYNELEIKCSCKSSNKMHAEFSTANKEFRFNVHNAQHTKHTANHICGLSI